LFTRASSKEQLGVSSFTRDIISFENHNVSPTSHSEITTAKLFIIDTATSSFLCSLLLVQDRGNSVNCEFMSVDHGGHLSLQFALYQPSLSFLRAKPLPRLFRCSFKSMSPISVLMSESSHEIANSFAELHTDGILLPSRIFRFPATANLTAFLRQR